MNYKFTCEESDNYYHDYSGTLRGAKMAASKHYDSSAIINIFDTHYCNDSGAEVADEIISIRLSNGRWIKEI